MKSIALDIETRKVPVVPPIVSRGRPVTKRWQVFMIGVKVVGSSVPVTVFDGGERQVLISLDGWLGRVNVTRIYYQATRQFDEMILRGRFINARRELLDKPGPWPHLSFASRYEWVCLKPDGWKNPDQLSQHGPELYNTDPDLVRAHCRVDVEHIIERIT